MFFADIKHDIEKVVKFKLEAEENLEIAMNDFRESGKMIFKATLGKHFAEQAIQKAQGGTAK